MHYFQGSREHRPPGGSLGGFLKVVVGYMFVSKKCGRFSKGCRKVVPNV